MIERLVGFALAQRLMVCLAGLALLFGGLYAFHVLDVVAYPDPSPPMIEVITQYPGWSGMSCQWTGSVRPSRRPWRTARRRSLRMT